MTDSFSPWDDDIAAHVALVRRLEILADMATDNTPARDTRADKVLVRPGDIAIVKSAGRLRCGVVTATGVDNDPASVRVAYLVPSALDAAQRHWTSRSALILSPDYPAREAELAAADFAVDVTAAHVAARQARRQGLLAQAVARGCVRRPWAAVVPVQYVGRPTNEVYRHPNQQATDALLATSTRDRETTGRPPGELFTPA